MSIMICPDCNLQINTDEDVDHDADCLMKNKQERTKYKDPEDLARQLHEWYLEATNKDGAKYNYEAVVPFDDLPEGSKMLDRYIATKVIGMLSECKTHILNEIIDEVEKLPSYHWQDVAGLSNIKWIQKSTIITHLKNK